MQLHYRVPLPTGWPRYDRFTLFSLWGSCFSMELADYLRSRLYRVETSPFGIMYNPLSIAEGVRRLLRSDAVGEGDLFYHEGRWHSSLHHGDYSHHDKGEAWRRISTAWEHHLALRDSVNVWLFTWGTAHVYEQAHSPHAVVSNCHRLPASHFQRRRLSVDEIVEVWRPIVPALQARGGEVVFTVSPIPHYRDGAHDNRLSKATLHLAIDELQRLYPGVRYFPSYEIVQDELRDYRFYQEDFAHPTSMAVRYVMERFAESCLRPDDLLSPQLKEWEKLSKQVAHRPHSSDPSLLRTYYTALLERLQAFRTDMPHPAVDQALEVVRHALTHLP